MRKINHLNMSHGDANNLYGWAFYYYLPVGRIKWLTQNGIGGLNVNTLEKIIQRLHIRNQSWRT